MKNTIITTMFTTGASLVITAVFFAVSDIQVMSIHVIFQIFGANIVINIGLLLTHQFEFRSVILEYLIDICYVIAVLVVFRAVFDWYPPMPVYVLVIMAVAIYILTLTLVLTRIKNDTDKINTLLRRRGEKEDANAKGTAEGTAS